MAQFKRELETVETQIKYETHSGVLHNLHRRKNWLKSCIYDMQKKEIK